MDINFPLILLWLVVITGVIWLLDIFWLAPKRQAAAERLEKERSRGRLPSDSKAITEAKQDLLEEPAIVEYAKSFFPVLALVFVLRSFLFEPFQIPSASMVPTLKIGDFILVNKYAYGIRLPVARTKVIDVGEPQRGDVMVFFPPHMNETYFIKRVIGLPGDEIRYINNTLYINGQLAEQVPNAEILPDRPDSSVMFEEIYGKKHLMQKSNVPGQYSRNQHAVVPEGHYFVMGDNRDNSLDSRAWGFVPEEDIVGKAVAIWMNWPALGSLPSFGRAGGIE
ncbi:signal peptidase I [Biformimicrobium ophioploci]|uniref:Signal peptidase I n=1 Tax=Biformimicrobium ophioploci TaxID=3036711 RepID=A0ABQ6LZX5_9GAMM|nr:signal peptidase I [Microbulbifer sp. NKW57]GMG87597.1 signal peptidase I [Microbulbifer sp. NKW57]